MDMGVAAHVAELAHVYPASQPESQRLAYSLGQVELGSKRKRLEAPPQFDHQTVGPCAQCKGPVGVASAFPQVLDMGVVPVDLEPFSVPVSKGQRGRDRQAG